MVGDDEGYNCALRRGQWVIIDRFGRHRGDQPRFGGDHGAARDHATRLNDGVYARRWSPPATAPFEDALKALSLF